MVVGLFAVKPCFGGQLPYVVVTEFVGAAVGVDERSQFARFVPVVGDGVACGIGAVGNQSRAGVFVYGAVAARVGVAQ